RPTLPDHSQLLRAVGFLPGLPPSAGTTLHRGGPTHQPAHDASADSPLDPACGIDPQGGCRTGPLPPAAGSGASPHRLVGSLVSQMVCNARSGGCTEIWLVLAEPILNFQRLTDNHTLRTIKFFVGLRKASTSVSAAEHALLVSLSTGKRCIVEVGVFEGVTSEIFCRVMDPGGRLYLVDPFYPETRLEKFLN